MSVLSGALGLRPIARFSTVPLRRSVFLPLDLLQLEVATRDHVSVGIDVCERSSYGPVGPSPGCDEDFDKRRSSYLIDCAVHVVKLLVEPDPTFVGESGAEGHEHSVDLDGWGDVVDAYFCRDGAAGLLHLFKLWQ